MLQIDSDTVVEDPSIRAPARVRTLPSTRGGPRSAPAAFTAMLTVRSSYAPSRQFDLVAALGATATVAVMLAGFVWMRVAPSLAMKQDLLVLDLAVTPPPAAHIVPRPHLEPHKTQPIVAPPPVVTVAAPSPVQTVPLPAPLPPVIAAPPAPPAAPAAPAPAPSSAPADGGDLSSRMIAAKPPTYPVESRRNKEEGTVVLTVLLDIEGRVADIAIAQGSGFVRLDHAALAAVRAWRWSPVTRNGAPVAVQGRVRIPFVLKR